MKRSTPVILCALVAAALPPASARAQDAAPVTPRSTPQEQPALTAACSSVRLARKSGVVTLTYTNGLRVHIRPVEGATRVSLHALVFGAELFENDDNRGISGAAAWASRPAPGADRAKSIRPGISPEGLTARWSGDAAGLDEALDSLRQWLTDPQVEEERLVAMRTRLTERRAAPPRPDPAAEQGKEFGRPGAESTAPVVPAAPIAPDVRGREQFFERHVAAAVGEVILGVPGRPGSRGRPAIPFTAEQCRAWLTDKLSSLPIEVAIVGNVRVADVELLVRERLGQLPARITGAATPATFASLRKLEREDPPAELVREVPVPAGADLGSMVLVSFPGADTADMAAVRRARVAARVLDALIPAALDAAGIECRQHSVISLPGRLYTGAGMINAQVRISGARGEAELAAAEIERLAARLAAGQVPEEQVRAAAEAAAKSAEQQLAQADYWPSVLVLCGPYALDPDELAGAPASYRAVTAADVAAAFKAAPGLARRVLVVAQPNP